MDCAGLRKTRRMLPVARVRARPSLSDLDMLRLRWVQTRAGPVVYRPVSTVSSESSPQWGASRIMESYRIVRLWIVCPFSRDGSAKRAAFSKIIEGFDSEDSFSRRFIQGCKEELTTTGQFRFGRLRSDQFRSFGMPESETLYEQACDRLQIVGGEPIEIDFSIFEEAGRMLFDGPWIAERKASIASFGAINAHSLVEVVAKVLKAADGVSGADVFSGMKRLAWLRRQCDAIFSALDVMAVPTAPRPFHDRGNATRPSGTQQSNRLLFLFREPAGPLRDRHSAYDILVRRADGHLTARAGLARQ